MKKLMRSVLTSVLAFALLVGCGSSNSSADSGKTVIKFWTPKWGDADTEWYEKVVKTYNESQDKVKVELEIIPGEAWDQKITAAQASGTGPDVVTMNYNKIAFSAKQGAIKPLDDYITQQAWDDLYDNVEGFVMYEGKHYAYPLLSEPSALLFYRTDMFKEAGLNPDMEIKTWDQLIEVGKKLRNGRTYGLTVAANEGDLGWAHWGWQGMIGNMPISDDWSKATINNENYEKLFEFYSTLYKEDIVPKQELAIYAEGWKPLAEGRTAMAITGSWGIGSIKREYPEIVEHLKVIPVPTPDGDKNRPTASLGGWTMAIDGNTKHEKEAAEFISWMLAEDTTFIEEYILDVNKLSKFTARKSVDEALSKKAEVQEDKFNKVVVEEVIPNAIPEPIYAWDISMMYSNALQEVIAGTKTPKQALETAEKEINDYIKTNNYSQERPSK